MLPCRKYYYGRYLPNRYTSILVLYFYISIFRYFKASSILRYLILWYLSTIIPYHLYTSGYKSFELRDTQHLWKHQGVKVRSMEPYFDTIVYPYTYYIRIIKTIHILSYTTQHLFKHNLILFYVNTTIVSTSKHTYTSTLKKFYTFIFR